MIRAFLAIELLDDMRNSLESCQNVLRKDLPFLKWVQPHAMHLTLKFLGDIYETQIELLYQAIKQVMAQWPCFSVEVKNLGLFPTSRNPRVLWIGVADESGYVADMVELLNDSLEPLGFSREAKVFTPHLTLARIKENGREVGQVLTREGHLMAPWIMGMLPVRHVCLFQSERMPTGSVYTKLWEVPLASDERVKQP